MTKESVAAEACEALGAGSQVLESYPSRPVNLGGLPVSRLLPVRERRLVGPWCFLDRFGPMSFSEGRPMDVASHPHIGLQTVSWLLQGEVVHNDSLGYEAMLGAGGVNVMTAGSGIAHAEQTPLPNSGALEGVQLWIALPRESQETAPGFEHIAEVPVREERGGMVRLFAGALPGLAAGTTHYSDLVGADLELHRGANVSLQLEPAYEHALLVLKGDAALEGTPLAADTLHYLGSARHEISLSSREGARVLLIGGLPFQEQVLMWWNFVARTPEEIAQARADWQEHRRFGEVTGYKGLRLEAPELARLARPNPVS